MADSTNPRELAPVFRFVARVWLNEPDETVLANWRTVLPLVPASGLNNDQADESLEDLQIEYCRLFIGPKDHLPPYQSVWQTGQLGGPASVSMERYLERSGFDRDNLTRDVPADHLGLQLDLFGWLLAQQPNAGGPQPIRATARDLQKMRAPCGEMTESDSNKGKALEPEASFRSETLRCRSEKMRARCGEETDPDSIANESEVSAVLNEFHAAHLTWPDELLSRVKTSSQSGFYRQVATVTHQLLNGQG